MTKTEFFHKMQAEGGFDAMADYMGYKQITDDLDLDQAWKTFCYAHQDMQNILDDWVDPDDTDGD